MRGFRFLRGKADAPPQETRKGEREDELEIYSGVRTEAAAFDGRILFAAKLMGLHGNRAEWRACRVGNDRVVFRLAADLDASAALDGLAMDFIIKIRPMLCAGGRRPL